jgi:predicted thioesterase
VSHPPQPHRESGTVVRVRPGDTATFRYTVAEGDTAEVLGSGALAVLGTPRLVAWCEAATCAAIDRSLQPGQTSVGTRIDLEHLAASPVGATVEVLATVRYVDGRLVRFEVVAASVPDERLVGRGEITRVVVDRDRFLSRLPGVSG